MSLSIFQVATGYSDWGGTERHILTLSENLRQRGHTVTLIVRPDSWMQSQAEILGFQSVSIRVMTQNDRSDVSLLRTAIRGIRPDVVHVHCNSDIIVHGSAARSERVPVRVLSRHLPFPFRNRFGAVLYTTVFFPQVVAVAGSVRDVLVDCGVSRTRISVVHNSIDVEAFRLTNRTPAEVRADLQIETNSIVVGLVGRVSEEKGHKVLVEAAQRIGRDIKIIYVIVGDGPDLSQIKSMAESSEVADRFIFCGYQDAVSDYMNAMDIVVVPSTWAEPCSGVILQAMALKKAVVGTNSGGTPEIIGDNVSGIIIPPSDSEGLARAIVRLAEDPHLRMRLGEIAFSRVSERFSISGMVDKIEALYLR